MSTTGHREQGAVRLALMLLAAAVTTAALVRRAWTLLPDGSAGASVMPVDRAVELAVLAAGSLAAAWLALSALVGVAYVAAGRLGHRWRTGEALLDRVAPAAVRRLARSAVGIGVGTGLALAPTAALAADAGEAGPDSAPASVVLDLGWQTASDTSGAADASGDSGLEVAPPADETATGTSTVGGTDADEGATVAVEAGDDATSRTGPAPVSRDVLPATTRDAADGGQGDTRVVLRGDTLWDIAAESLGGSPSDADVLREMTRWHEANRDVVGDDPDLILPGQVLRTPGSPAG